MHVAIITVGDELLSGDVVNTNAAWLGEQLASRGANVERMIVVPDRIAAVAREVNEARAEYDAVIVTGGLGPTHDDVTMEGVAAAFGVPVVEHPDVERWFAEHDRYARADLAAGTTHLPKGVEMLPNEVGVAPGAIVDSVYVLPGVPAEMKAMFEGVESAFGGTKRHVAFVYADEPESALIDRVAELRERFDVKVGSYPGEMVRIKLESAEEGTLAEAETWLRERVDGVEPSED
jgi:molybdenum cofactor synthesis domain-containing protein